MYASLYSGYHPAVYSAVLFLNSWGNRVKNAVLVAHLEHRAVSGRSSNINLYLPLHGLALSAWI